MPESVTRYVITWVPDRGQGRTLLEPRQGRYTYETKEEAEALMSSFLNNPEGLTRVMSATELRTVEVRPCPCYPGHFDPQTCWFD